ncbi:MAG TPA: TonB-dependent receptor [Chitinophagaceae bacterium]|jgi:TonB-linked SusC/RagA family outer membrane protein|nr:TonB-dependent receptor [Chitinophagaceae bacterium]
MTKIAKCLAISFLAIFFICPLNKVYAQGRQITGKVTSSENKQPLAGVTVTAKGTKNAVITDIQGNYKITVDNNAKALVFSSTGFIPYEASIVDQNAVNVEMTVEVKTQEEVVVIGYQAIPKRNLSSSVSSIGAKDLKDNTITSAAEALNGRLAGVTATTSEGSPDAVVRVRVRGGISITQNNDPLYIVDGVQVENALNVIAPGDIQSIDVLKDAAATAIYGARGANGVFVITTKSGKPGRTIIYYDGFVGIRELAKKLKVMSPYDYIIYQWERTRPNSTDSTNFASSFGSTWDTLNVYKNVPGIDWQEKVMGNTGITTRHNVSVSGGNKKATFNLGYTFNNEKPIVVNSNYNRHILNAKGDYKITDKIKFGAGARYTYQDVVGAGISSESSTSYARLRNAVKYRPFLADTLALDDPDPLVVNPGNGVALVNPVALSDAEYRRKITTAYNLNANISYNITKHLNFRSTFGYDKNDFIDKQFFDSITSFSVNQGGGKPIIHVDTVYRKVINNSNVFTYSVKGFKQKHDFDILLGEETYESTSDSRSGQFGSFPKFTSYKDAFGNTDLGTVWTGYPVYVKAKYTNLSFFGRLNYGFLDKYLVSLNIRYDGASKFAQPKRWGTFPGGSIAWRVKREKFMENVNFISDLKLRFGYGKIGNNRIDDYLYLTTFNYGTSFYALNNQIVNAYTENSLANPDLQWESLVNRNYGVDISLFKGRVDMSVDVYNNTSDKLLLRAKIAPTYGFTDQLQNVGATSNKGFEVQLNGIIMRKSNGLNWSANFNISHNKNTVEGLAKGQTEFAGGPAWGISGQPNDYLVRIGSPVGSMYGWVTDGFYKPEDFDYNPATTQYTLKSGVAEMKVSGSNVVPGALRFKDISGPLGKPDGVIDDFDKTIIGNPTPKFSGGLNQQFNYKNWDASVFVNFSYGNDIYNANKIEFTSAYNVTSNLLDEMSGRWRTVDANGNVIEKFQLVNGKLYAFGAAPDLLANANANAKIWMPSGLTNFGSGTGNFSYYLHSWAIEDGSFLRLNNVTIGYTMRPKTKIGITKLRFYLTGSNLAIITSYSGYDPEVSVRNNGLTPGLDYSAYPKSHTYIFGVQATF